MHILIVPLPLSFVNPFPSGRFLQDLILGGNEKWVCTMHTHFLSFLDKLFPAFGAGNGYLSFSFRYTNRLAAPGAVKVFVIFILYALQQHQIFPVFPVALIGIAGQGAKYGPDH